MAKAGYTSRAASEPVTFPIIASLVPVWILLQPRDYLSSFLLYGMMIIAFVGIILSAITGSTTFEMPAFTGWSNKLGTLFPALFITVACGACSGFHSLIATDTSSKQLANERDIKPIGYGSMLIESALGIISLIAVGMVFTKYTAGEFGSPSAAFAGGIALMFGADTSAVYGTIYALLTLAVSVFALTSLVMTVIKKIGLIGSGAALWGDWFQLLFAAAMAILACFLVVEGIQTFLHKGKASH